MQGAALVAVRSLIIEYIWGGRTATRAAPCKRMLLPKNKRTNKLRASESHRTLSSPLTTKSSTTSSSPPTCSRK